LINWWAVKTEVKPKRGKRKALLQEGKGESTLLKKVVEEKNVVGLRYKGSANVREQKKIGTGTEGNNLKGEKEGFWGTEGFHDGGDMGSTYWHKSRRSPC